MTQRTRSKQLKILKNKRKARQRMKHWYIKKGRLRDARLMSNKTGIS